jgi:tRNA1(Val) A37 N6-methylase TrmN6
LLSNAKRYVGVDVSPAMSDAAREIAALFSPFVKGKQVQLDCSPFETWRTSTNARAFDLALTSPPYFDTEKYIGGEQSHSTHDDYAAWRDGFYTSLIAKTHSMLRKSGVFCLQVGSQKYPLTDDGKQIARDVGFEYVETRSTGMLNMQTQTDDERAEIVLVLKKR